MKTSSHRLNLNQEGLESFCLHVAGQSLMESHPDEKRTQYLMPDGRTTLQVRKFEDTAYLDITTTTLLRPLYVTKLIKAVNGGENCHTSSSSSPNTPRLSWIYNYAKKSSETPSPETVNGGGG